MEVQGQDYKYFSQGGWAMMNDFKSEEARVGIPYLERPQSFALLQHEYALIHLLLYVFRLSSLTVFNRLIDLEDGVGNDFGTSASKKTISR